MFLLDYEFMEFLYGPNIFSGHVLGCQAHKFIYFFSFQIKNRVDWWFTLVGDS